MFNTAAYMTRSFQSDVPLMTQMVLMNLLSQAKETQREMDYLQVFKLRKSYSNGKALQEIIHSQEVPPFTQTVFLSMPEDQITTTKISIIDDGDHHTYLLASEY